MRLFRSLRRPLGGFMTVDEDRGDRHEAEVDRAVDDRLGHLTRKLEKIMHTLEEVLGLVRAQKTKIDSLNTLMDGIRQQLKDLLGGTLTPTQQMHVDQIFDAAKDNADAIDEAITENTPEATAGAVTDGPSLADLKNAESLQDPAKQPAEVVDPEPATSEK